MGKLRDGKVPSPATLLEWTLDSGGDEVGFNAPLDTIQVISLAVFTANHFDKQNSKENTDKQTQYKSEK